MARILLSAYACAPNRGSEPAVGWNWARELARMGHDVTVITRSKNRVEAEAEAQRSCTAIRFIYYDLPNWLQRWGKRSGTKSIRYVLWQWFAARRIRQRFPSLPFDLVHHVTYVSARYPSFMSSLGIPFWFGPVSGGEAVPAPLRPGFSAGQRCREWLRDVSNKMVAVDPFMRRTFRRADRILVTRDTVRLLPRSCRTKSIVQLAIGLPDEELELAPPPPKPRPRELQLLYVGRLLEWKGIDLVLLALKQLLPVRPGVRLNVVGRGQAKSGLLSLSQQLGLREQVQWAGWQSRHNLARFYDSADVFVFPSLRDSGGTVVLEALSRGLPVVCTDLGGPGVIVDSTCGRVLPTAGRRREQLAQHLSSTLLEILDTPDLLASLSYGARVRSRQFTFHDLVRSVYADMPTNSKCISL